MIAAGGVAMVRLGDLGEWTGGGTPSKSRAEFWEGGSIPWVSPKDMKQPFIDSSEDKITPLALEESAAKLIPAGSVLVVTRSGILEHTLPIATTRVDTAINQDLKALTPAESIDPEYVAYALRTHSQEILRSCSKKGTTVSSIVTSRLLDFRVPLPDPVEQRRIVESLDCQSTRLEAARANLKGVRARLDQHRASLLQAACAGLLFTHPDETDQDGREASLPVRWRKLKVKEVGEVQLGRQRAPEHHSGPNMRPYLRVANVLEDELDLTDVKEMNFTPEAFEKYKLEPGDILLNEGQSKELVGRPAMFRGEMSNVAFQNTLIRFRSGPEILPEFALLVFRSYLHNGRFMEVARWTTNIAHLGSKRFSEMDVPVPPLNEQRRIIMEVERAFSILDATQTVVERAQQRSRALWWAIRQRSFPSQVSQVSQTQDGDGLVRIETDN